MSDDYLEDLKKEREKIKFPLEKKDIENIKDLKRKFKIDKQTMHRKIADIVADENIKVDTFFQREFVWSEEKQSALIESILCSLPVPAVYSYLVLGTNDEYIIDGQQRLTTVKRFVKNGFPLKKLQTLSYLDDLTFDTLPKEYQNIILNYVLTIERIENVADKQVIFQIFKRFNTGGMNLNAQEVRNAVFSGAYNDFIKELASYKPLEELLAKVNTKRFVKEELALRFLSLYEKMDSYTGNMARFLNAQYESKKHLDDMNFEELQNLIKPDRSAFQKSVLACKFVFGNNAFKKIVKLNEGTPRETFAYGKFNKLVFDMQMQGFAQEDTHPEVVKRYANQIREAYEKTIIKNHSLEPCHNNDNSGTAKRFRNWQEIVHKIIST